MHQRNRQALLWPDVEAEEQPLLWADVEAEQQRQQGPQDPWAEHAAELDRISALPIDQQEAAADRIVSRVLASIGEAAAPNCGEVPWQLQEQIDRAGLSPRHKHVLQERLKGRSHADIAHDDLLLTKVGRPLSKQRLHQIEAEATRAAGLTLHSIEQCNACSRAEQAERFHERASLITGRELWNVNDINKGREPLGRRRPD